MSESKAHKEAKGKAAGKNEVQLKDGRRLDSASENRATEVERSESQSRLEEAVERLRDSGRRQKVLQVPEPNMSKAIEAMKKKGVSGSVKNMSGTNRRSV